MVFQRRQNFNRPGGAPRPGGVAGTAARGSRDGANAGYTIGRGGGRGGSGASDEFDSKVVAIDRVTRVMAGGKRMRFRATVVVGNKKGKVGSGVAKGLDVAAAVAKATTAARKNLITVPLRNGTIPHRVDAKYKAAILLLKPAPKGTGLRAGGALRIVLELAGVENVSGKILGSKNKLNNIRATIQALQELIPTRPPHRA